MGDDPTSSILLYFFIIFALTLFSGFFSAAEIAFISLDRLALEEMQENGHKRASQILTILEEPSRFLNTIQISITLINFTILSFAFFTIFPIFEGWFNLLNLSFSKELSYVVGVLLLTFLVLTLGEFVPKRLVVRSPNRFAFFAVSLISPLSKLFSPLAVGLSFTTRTILKFLGVDLKDLEEKVTLENIRSMVEVGQEQGIINPIEKEMIDSVISFDDRQAEEIMTARTEVFMIDINDKLEDYVSEMLSLKFSRIPVYENQPDNIIGILYLKDFLLAAYKKQSFSDINIRGIIRPAYFVPERKNINDLFSEMQEEHRHMALLIDEYGGFSGLVTMEDLIEEIMGDIDDEYDHDEPDIYQIGENTYHVHGTISIKEFNSETGADIDEDSEDYDTIGGFIISVLDYIPENGERPIVEYENLIFQVLKVAENRIMDIRVTIITPETT